MSFTIEFTPFSDYQGNYTLEPQFPRDVKLSLQILRECIKYNYEIVSIGQGSKLNPTCWNNIKNNPYGLWGWSRNLTKCLTNIPYGICAIWIIAEKFKVYDGCGNTHQVQIPYNNNNLVFCTVNLLTYNLDNFEKDFNNFQGTEFMLKHL